MAERTLSVDVVTPSETLFSDDQVLLVSAPATEGRVGILPAHMPFISTLDPGELHIRPKTGDEQRFTIGSGFIQVKHDRVIILTEQAEVDKGDGVR